MLPADPSSAEPSSTTMPTEKDDIVKQYHRNVDISYLFHILPAQILY